MPRSSWSTQTYSMFVCFVGYFRIFGFALMFIFVFVVDVWLIGFCMILLSELTSS